MMRPFFVVTSLLLVSVPALAQTRIAVLPVQHKTGISQDEADLITEQVTAEVGKRPDLKVIGAGELRNLVTFEQQKTLLGCADDSCLAEVGAALGVDAIVSGTLGSLGGLLLFNLTLMDARKSVVLSRHNGKYGTMRELLNALPAAADKLMTAIPVGVSVVKPAAQSKNPLPPAETAAPPAAAEAPTAAPAAKDETTARSSTPRRIAGLGVAGAGGALLLVGLVFGAASVGWLLVGRFVPGVPLTTGLPKYGGFGVAGIADVIGIVSVVIIAAGIVVAVLP